MSKLLIESEPVTMQLVEGKGDRLIARGEFGRVGVATQNGRIYPEDIMNREIERLDEDISNRRVLGELDHPTDGKTSLKRVSHVLTGLSIKNGIIIGEAEILNTPEGQTLKALIEAKVQLAVSSRGYGSTKTSTDPKMEGEVVQEDFVLKTWDFVADPAVKTALPQIYQEDVEEQKVSPADMFLAEFPEIANQIKEDALAEAKEKLSVAEPVVSDGQMEDFEKRFAAAILEAREEISTELREEFESDPQLGGARATLDAIFEMAAQFRATPDEKAAADAIRAKDMEVQEATEAAEEFASKAIQSGAALAAERKFAGHPMAESIRSLVDKQEFGSEKEAIEFVESVISDMPDAGDIVARDELELREKNARLEEKVSLLEEKAVSLSAKLKRVVEVGGSADTQLREAESRVQEAEEAREVAEEQLETLKGERDLIEHKYKKVASLSNGLELLELLEDANSQRQVDLLVSKRGVGVVKAKELAEMRENLRRGKSTRQGQKQLHEDKKKSISGASADELGNDIGDMCRLAGINNLD